MSAHGVDRTGAASGSGAALNPIDQTIIDAKGDLIAGTAADAAARLAVGANDTFLIADSTQTTGLKWAGTSTARTALSVPSNAETILQTIIDAKGDLVVGTAADTAAKLTVGANGTVPMARSADTKGLAYVAALTKAIYGLTYSNTVADSTNDLDIAAGGAMDATGAYWMTLSAITKQSDANWAVGTNAGGLDTGAVGNSDYYIWLIARSDTGVVDVLYSLSSTAPTMPGAGAYDFKRLIGWFKRVGGTIVAFHTYEIEGGGLELIWDVPTLDVSIDNALTQAKRTDAVKVPLNFSTVALLNVEAYDAAASHCTWIFNPDHTGGTDPAPTTAPGATLRGITSLEAQASIEVRTSSTGTIAARANLATIDNYRVVTRGFKWARRN